MYGSLGCGAGQEEAMDVLLFGKRPNVAVGNDADEEDGLAHDGNQDKDESETWKKLENLYGVLRPFVMRRSKGDNAT